MKFSEIKDRIQNLGNIKTLKEIKKAGLRICRNTKTGNYWLIEEEYLKKVFKSPKDSKKVVLNESSLKNILFGCYDVSPKIKAKEYINWGENEGYNKRPSCKSRNPWWSTLNYAPLFVIRSGINENYSTFFNPLRYQIDKVMYGIEPRNNMNLGNYLNSSIFALMLEIHGQIGLGDGLLFITVEDLNRIPALFLEKDDIDFDIQSIKKDLNIERSCVIPCESRLRIDRPVFEVFGLNKNQINELYISLYETMNRRLEKAKNV